MYLIIELHGGAENAYIITNENGNNLVLNTLQEVKKEADNCHNPLIIDLSHTLPNEK